MRGAIRLPARTCADSSGRLIFCCGGVVMPLASRSSSCGGQAGRQAGRRWDEVRQGRHAVKNVQEEREIIIP